MMLHLTKNSFTGRNNVISLFFSSKGAEPISILVNDSSKKKVISSTLLGDHFFLQKKIQITTPPCRNQINFALATGRGHINFPLIPQYPYQWRGAANASINSSLFPRTELPCMHACIHRNNAVIPFIFNCTAPLYASRRRRPSGGRLARVQEPA